MKTTILKAIGAGLLMLLLIPRFAAAQSDEEMAQQWMEMIAPVEQHEFLGTMAGTWEYKQTWWMAPGSPPQSQNGTSTKEMIMGGRYLTEHLTGSTMGMEMEGRATHAYDKMQEKFLATWIDNLGTGIMVFEGEMTGDNELTLVADYFDPMAQENQQHKQVFTITSDKSHRMDYYIVDKDGKEFKSMEVIYNRKK